MQALRAQDVHLEGALLPLAAAAPHGGVGGRGGWRTGRGHRRASRHSLVLRQDVHKDAAVLPGSAPAR